MTVCPTTLQQFLRFDDLNTLKGSKRLDFNLKFPEITGAEGEYIKRFCCNFIRAFQRSPSISNFIVVLEICPVLRRGSAISDWDVSLKFEEEFCDWQGCRHAITYPNGTAAILAAMFGLKIGLGDEVICPSITYWASALPCYSLGATPCSVKTRTLLEYLSSVKDVTVCDILVISSLVRSNMKSSGNREIFLVTA